MLGFCFLFFSMLIIISMVAIISALICFICLKKIKAATLVVICMIGIPIFLVSFMYMCTFGFFLYR